MAYLALDLGAGSGRAIVGTIKDNQIQLEEIHRFNNTPVKLGDTIYWDFLSLFNNIKQGIYLAQKKGYKLKSVAIDTWGVDFGLIDKQGKLLSNPVTYRDTRTQGMLAKALKLVPSEEIYKHTGIQQMEINSLFQLLSMEDNKDPFLEIANKLLFTPDLINYFLTGKIFNEYTIASTSQLLNADTKQWESTLFDKLGLNIHIMADIIQPGNLLGALLPSIEEETETKNVKVYAVGSHDTASAVAAIPANGDDWAFLSSGTWSLLGIETDKPVLTQEALENEFTNEGGVNEKILFMRNCTGLWLLQNLMSEWEKKETDTPNTYEYLLSECAKAPEFRSIVNTDDAMFSNPTSMSEAIQDYCKRDGQAVPTSKGEFMRCVLESLALKYYFVIDKLKKCTNKQINSLYVVGGGSKNDLLNQYTANALGMNIITGLSESTALGNIIQQAVADGQIANIDEGRMIIKNSFELKTHYPEDTQKWINVVDRVKHLF